MAASKDSQPEGITEKRFVRQDKNLCPVCGDEYADVTDIHAEHSEKGVPGRAYDHDRGSLCIEWSNGEIEQND